MDDDDQHRDREVHLEFHLRRTDRVSRAMVLATFVLIWVLIIVVVLIVMALGG